MRFDGHLKSWNDERGFGFIEPVQGGQEIFIHIKAFPAGTGRPAVGQALSFEVELNAQGKKRAKAVQYPVTARKTKAQRPEAPAPWTLPRVAAIPLFVLVYAYVSRQWPVSPVVPVLYLLASLVAFMAYALDKSAALAGRWRVSERMLHALGLACGWPGALLAQQMLRHKSSKPSFLAVYWTTVGVNIAGFVVYHAQLLAALRP
ncbi:DUF1294 domain-containing protein [Aquabacterium sp.]|uniref:DUF1294 domain-containing protein n=1 Tax=Aquabacterium sp. TaxID=1872578 RepID=UPI002C88CE11|nr:DUF1294 domain-containing protein [Aquabacterium sp.]HSW04962.1 DUF1294 domain-containing protein [Aquabacterium sp.]